MIRRTRPARASRRALALAAGLLVSSAVTIGVTGTAQATRADRKMVVRVDKAGGNECFYRPGQLIAPPGMAATITAVTGIRGVKEGASLVPERLRQLLPNTVQRLSLYTIGSADPFDAAAAMAAAGYGSIAPNYISSFAPVRTWAPGGDSKQTVTPNPISVGAPTAGKGMRVGVFDTGYSSKLPSVIPGEGTVTYLPAQNVRATLAAQGLIEPGYIQPLELTSGRAAGHGTYITGLIRRALPAASIVVSQVPFTGPTDASFNVDPNPGFATDASSRADDAAITFMLYTAFLSPATGKTSIDILSLSFGSYGCNTAFNPELGAGDFRTPLGIRSALLGLWERSNRTLIVTSAAGNDATDEPFYPAGFAAASCFDPSNLPPNSGPALCEMKTDAVSPWLAAVGSTKSATIGSYSNYGPWINVTADGSDVASVLGTMSWARWSGTSFAAPCAAIYAAEKGALLQWQDVRGATLDCGLRDRTVPAP